MTRRPVPHDPEAEACLVSCVNASFQVADPAGARALGELSSAAFLVPSCKAIWRAMQIIYDSGEPVNPLTIKAELEKNKYLGSVGGFAGLSEVLATDEFGRPGHLVDRIRDLYERRTMLKIADKLVSHSEDQMLEPARIRSEIAQNLMELDSHSKTTTVRTGTDLLVRLTDFKAFRPSDGSKKLLHFPFQEWNDHIECAPGHVILLGARPKVGKSALAIDSMVCSAMQGRKPFLISLEMDDDEVEARLAGRTTGRNYRMFLGHDYSERQIQPALDKADAISLMSWWCHPSGVAWSRVEAEIRERVRTSRIDCAIIDYFTLIAKPTGTKGATDATLWGILSMCIKRLAQELKICIMLIAQLNRDGAEVEPHAHNFRETGQLEQDANAIIMLWKKGEDGKVWGKVAENRSGPAIGKRELELDGGTNTFTMQAQEPGTNITATQGEMPWNMV